MHILDTLARDSFNAIIDLRHSSVGDDIQTSPTPAWRHAQVRAQLDKFCSQALACGMNHEDVRSMTYALAALADVIASKVKGPLSAFWVNHLLVTHYFHDAPIHLGFFERLDAARAEGRRDVLRIYALCLALGFRGRLRGTDAERALMTLQGVLHGAEAASHLLPTQRLENPDRRPWQALWLPLGALLCSLALYVILCSSMRSEAASFASWISGGLRIGSAL